jgi:polyisoprenoid-binding protein YceI
MNIKLLFLTSCFIILTAFAFKRSKTYVISTDSTVNWACNGVGHGHHGSIQVKSGFVILEKNKLTQGEVIIDMRSLSNLDIDDSLTASKFVGHLLSKDFFVVNSYPTSKLVITDATDMSNVKGEMTIKDVTEEITFSLCTTEVEGGLELSTTLNIDRTKFGNTYNSVNFFEDLGDYLINDEFTLEVKLMAK